VSLPGNNLRSFILLLGFMAVFVVSIGVALAAGNPKYGAAYLAAFAVLGGGLLGIASAFTRAWLTAVVKHARLLREGFFEPLSQSVAFTEDDWTVSVRANVAAPPQPVGMPPSADWARVDGLELFRFAFDHFNEYPGLKRTWKEAADEVELFNSAEQRRLRILEALIVSRLGTAGLTTRTDGALDSDLNPGETNLRLGTTMLRGILSSPTVRFGPEVSHLHVAEDLEQSPTMLVLNGRPFIRNRTGSRLDPNTIANLLESSAADAHRTDAFRARAVELSRLEKKLGALRQAARLVSGHIGASDWIQGSCDTGL
jgi:hypothetical protein